MKSNARLKRRLAWCLFGLASLGGCSNRSMVSPVGPGCHLAVIGDLTLHQIGSHLAIDVTIEGKPASLIFDTGGYSSILSAEGATRLGLRRKWSRGPTIEGLGGTVGTAIVRVHSLQVGNLHGRGFPLIVSAFDTHVTEGADGILGMDFLRDYDIDLDLPGNRVVLYAPMGNCARPSAYLHEPLYTTGLVGARPGEAFAPGTSASQPRVEVSVHGVELTAVLDTGAPHNLLFKSGAAKLGLTISRLPVNRPDFEGGIGPAAVPARHHVLEPLEIGELELSHLPISVVDGNFRGVADILLGIDLFRRVHVWISHSSGSLIMQFPPEPSPLGKPGRTSAVTQPPPRDSKSVSG